MPYKYLIIFVACLSNIQYTSADQSDFTVFNENKSIGCVTTIDINITKKLAEQNDLIIDYNYEDIRTNGVIMNVYYSNAVGKAQWTEFPSPSNIYLMPNSILLPLKRWIKNGMQTNGKWWVRVVMLKGGECDQN